jgi:hypothetical protein
MTTTTATATRPVTTPAGTVRRTRALAAVSATAATSAVWGVMHAAGADFVISTSSSRGTISLPVVVLVTLGFSAVGWAALALLERFTRSAARIWTTLALVVTALSLVPIFLDSASGTTRAGLTLIHLAVAAVLIPAFRTSRSSRS